MLGNCKFFSCSICSSNAIFTALMLITKLPSRLVLLPKIRSQDQQLIYRVYNLWVVLWAVMLVIPDDISRLCLHDTVSPSLEAPLSETLMLPLLMRQSLLFILISRSSGCSILNLQLARREGISAQLSGGAWRSFF